MKLSDLTKEQQIEWNKKWKRFQRAWVKKHQPQGAFSLEPIREAFYKKHNIEQ